MEDSCEELTNLVQKIFLTSGLGTEKENLLDHTVKIRPVCIYQRVKVTLLLAHKLEHNLPRALDHLELAIRVHLAYEVDHLRKRNAHLVPLVVQLCRARTVSMSGRQRSTIDSPGTRRNVRAAPATCIQPLLSVLSMRLIFQR